MAGYAYRLTCRRQSAWYDNHEGPREASDRRHIPDVWQWKDLPIRKCSWRVSGFSDASLHHWVTAVDREYTYPKGFGREVQNLAALFYTDDGLLVTP